MRTLSKAEQKKFEKLKVDLGTIVLGTATPQKRAGFVRSVKGCAERKQYGLLEMLKQHWDMKRTTGDLTSEQKYRAAFPELQEFIKDAINSVEPELAPAEPLW
jgi:ribosome recycling factor